MDTTSARRLLRATATGLVFVAGVAGWGGLSNSESPETRAGEPQPKTQAAPGQNPSPQAAPAGRPPQAADASSPPVWVAREATRLANIRCLTRGGERTGEAYFSPDGRTIIFQRVPDGQKHYQIYTLDLTDPAAQPVMVSTGKGACTCGHFRPDGRKIIWASNHEDPDILAGRSPAEETVPGYQKQGRTYRWAYPRHMNIYESDLDGTQRRALTTGPYYTAEGSYSPDGREIVFASDRTGDIELYVMNADGSDVRRLTDSPGYDGGPFFSPDGQQVLWRSDRKAKDLLQVYVANRDGSQARPLTDNHAVNWGPTWHPSGQYVIFSSSLGSPPGRHAYDLWLIDNTGDQLERITWHPGPDILPVFSPNGRHLMWTARREGDPKTQIYMADWLDSASPPAKP